MLPYMYGPALDLLSIEKKIEKIENAAFGYQMKRAGVKNISEKEWSLTYSRTIMGTQETFKINCDLTNDKCRVYFDNKKWNEVFKN